MVEMGRGLPVSVGEGTKERLAYSRGHCAVCLLNSYPISATFQTVCCNWQTRSACPGTAYGSQFTPDRAVRRARFQAAVGVLRLTVLEYV